MQVTPERVHPAPLLAACLLLLVVLTAAGWYLFTGWRARDLASKARESFEKGNYRMAWLQLKSARDLRAGDPEVLRTGQGDYVQAIRVGGIAFESADDDADDDEAGDDHRERQADHEPHQRDAVPARSRASGRRIMK